MPAPKSATSLDREKWNRHLRDQVLSIFDLAEQYIMYQLAGLFDLRNRK